MSDKTTDYSRLTQPRAEEELHQSPESPMVLGDDPKDGMPAFIPTQNMDTAPPLSEESLVCMADKRSFVIRHKVTGAVLVSFTPDEVTRLANGWHVAKPPEGMLFARDPFPQLTIAGVEIIVQATEIDGVWQIYVEPVRPACAHYLRMMTDISADRGRRFIGRSCMAMRSEDGEYTSLRDAMVTACTLRSPPHYESEALLESFDEQLKLAGIASLPQNEFDVDAALDNERPSPPSAGGIFG